MITSDAVSVVRLTEVFRQASTSRVIVNAHRINHGQMPDPGQAVAKMLAVVRDRNPRAFGLDSTRDVQVLSPMNRGGVGARSLKIELQRALNPPGETRVESFGWTFAPGDKVMQVEDNCDR